MSAITLTADSVAPVFPRFAEIYDVILAEAATRGQAGYQLSTGKFGLADANASGKQQCRGLYVTPGGAGQGVSLLKRGHVYGFDLSGLNWDAPVYLSDTVGALDTAAGTMSVVVGRVVAMPDGSLTKVLYVECNWETIWS